MVGESAKSRDARRRAGPAGSPSPVSVARPVVAVSIFIVFAIMAGGGGSPEPLPELAVQIGGVVLAGWWLFLAHAPSAPPRPAIVLSALLLALPALQIVPLPPAAWQAIPGREAIVESLRQVGAADTWQSWSVAPHRTFASLLALLPPVILLLSIASLPAADRVKVLPVIAGAGTLSALFGLIAWAGGWSLYAGGHSDWVTGFHANRNAAADLFLIALWALAAWHQHGRFFRRVYWLAAPVLLLAIVLTGSRTVIALTLLSGLLALVPAIRRSAGRAVGVITLILGALLAVWVFAEERLRPIAARFDATGDAREALWTDSWHALTQYWPMGSGVGTFALVFPASERLEAVDGSWPNRAHNDYLELALEVGLPGIAVLLACVTIAGLAVLQAWRARALPRAVAIFASGTLGVIALHSLVDYPLRSLSLACLVALAVGMCMPAPGRARPLEDSRDGT